MTSLFAAPPGQEGKVRALLGAIALMTLVMAFMLGMIVGRLLTPGAAPLPDALNAADLPVLEITLPAGARSPSARVSDGRLIVAYDGAPGSGALIAAAPSRPVHLTYATAASASDAPTP